jgi:PAS domain S-box-containing protein
MEQDAFSGEEKNRNSFKKKIEALISDCQTNMARENLNNLLAEVENYQTEMEQKASQLKERTKELSLFYHLFNLVVRQNISEKDFLRSLTDKIPEAWQYPEFTCVRILYGDKEFTTSNFKPTPWCLSADIVVNQKKAGCVEVYYLKQMPESTEGPFLKEERSLIDSVAIKTGHYFERKIMRKELVESEENLRITLNSIGDAVITTNTFGAITSMNPVAENLTGWKYNDALNKPVDEVFIIENAQTGERVQNPIEIVLKTGMVVGLANHTKLISKSGKEYQISDSGAPIKNQSGNVVGVVLVFRDVTEEYKLQQELRESEERWQFALEGAGDGVWDWNLETGKIFFSDQWKKILGYEPHEIENDYKEWKIRVHPDDLANAERDIQSYLNGKTDDYTNEHRLLCKNGTYKWILDRGKMVEFGKNGKPKRFVGTHADITKLKNADEIIREHERQLESMVENLPGFIYRCKYDKNWTMLYLSPQFEKITGYPVADFIQNKNRAFNDIIEKDFQPEVFKKWEVAVAEKSVFEAEYPFVTHNNQIKWVWERGTGVFDNNGNVLFLEGYIEDITPRKQMEEKIRYGEKKFRQITENMSDVVWTADLNFKTTYISPSVELLLGETLEEHLKKSIQQRLSPESILKVQSILADEMEKEKNHESDKSRSRKMEIQHYKADGTLIWVEMNISSIRNEKGEMIGFQGVTRDISERKKAETELKRKVEELERFNRVMVGRENKMIDLKREVNELLEKLGQNKKYRVPGKSEEA